MLLARSVHHIIHITHITACIKSTYIQKKILNMLFRCVIKEANEMKYILIINIFDFFDKILILLNNKSK